MPGHDHHAGLPVDVIVPAAVVTLTLAYLALALRARRSHSGQWPLRRTVSFVLGAALVVWALAGPLRVVHGSFTAHMAQHLLLGMLGPFLMVLGAPMRLLLRWGPRTWRPVIGRLLHARPVRFLAHPVVALMFAVGSLPLVYATSLYELATTSPAVHLALHAHFLASGYLFAWVICGPDPAPGRASVPARLVVLGVSVAVHASVSQLMYAGVFPAGVDPVDLRRGATLMYYGGDLVELALALVLVAGWRPRRPPPGSPRDTEVRGRMGQRVCHRCNAWPVEAREPGHVRGVRAERDGVRVLGGPDSHHA